ncbi:MAG: 2OG-Fe(II) oxygenase [Pseudomonadota bacterium]
MLHQLPCRLLCANPLVAVVDGFLDTETCNRIISQSQGHLKRAEVGTDDAPLEVTDDRTNSECSLKPDGNADVATLMQRLADVLALPVAHGEGLSVLHYAVAEEFKPHADGIWSGAEPEAIATFEADGGQRLFTAMVYLNAVEAGGGTSFPKLGFRVDPAPGRLLIFANTPAGDRDVTVRALHAGEPVTAGEKWAAVSWWRERPYAPSG